MATASNVLFSWADVEKLPELRRLDLVLDTLPDGELIAALESARGRGRDDYPVRAMWRALVAGVVFGHRSIASLLRELGRNPALLAACGFDPLARQSRPRTVLERDGERSRVVSLTAPCRSSIPSHWNFSRFVRRVVEHEALVRAMFERLREELMEALPDFGEHLGYDGKALESHSTGRVNRDTGTPSDRDADWGRHETHGVDANSGTPWTKVKTWFGYGLHLIADTRYEVPVDYRVTPASHSEVKELEAMVGEGFEDCPELARRCRDLCADRGLDSGPLKATLWDDYRIRPLIEPRELWREEKAMPDYDPTRPITRALFPERADTLVYTEKGQVQCRCPASGEKRDLAFWGFESDRNTLKYRCPAAVYDLQCTGREACERGAGGHVGAYGRIVRIDLDEHDRRIFTPTPWGSPSWKRGYHRRSALERINNRIDHGYEFEQHFIRGLARMRTRVGVALAVMLALALGHLRAGRCESMRSLFAAVPFADTG